MIASADKLCNAMILNYLAASLLIQSQHKINAAITKLLWAKQAAATHLELRVAASANKIANALALYFYAASLYYSYWFVRESWLWHVLSRLDSFSFGGALQNAKKKYTRLSQIKKYCVMRECDSIHSWISLSGDLAFSHHDGIYGFKLPKRFLEISSRDLTLFSILII
jgi:hypothetical protein